MKLTDSVQFIKGVGPKRQKDLSKLGIKTVYDLITWYPRTYEDQSVLTKIANIKIGEQVTVSGTVMNISDKKAGRRGMTIITALIGDGSGFLQLTWFNQKYLKQQLKIGKRLFVTGKAGYAYGGQGQLAMTTISSWQILDDDDTAEGLTGILPVYPLTAALSQKFVRNLLKTVLSSPLEDCEVIPDALRQKFNFLPRHEAWQKIHFPTQAADIKLARRQLAFEELFLIQCGLLWLKKQSQTHKQGITHQAPSVLTQKLLKSLPFALTNDQSQAWQDIVRDMNSQLPMRRLVQGDVGSGKTVIAMLALTKTVENGYQGALMAPTEILARQHYEGFLQQLAPLGIRIGFLSGRLTKKQREKMYQAIAEQSVDIVIGTHALIQDGVNFKKLGLVVTDEQHRFGIAQRAKLEKQGETLPDVLIMTATPIPRTMTLTVYGDLDVSVIKQLPPGRQPIRTFLRRPDRRELIYKYVLSQIQAGRQAYVVCPLIELNEDIDLPSAEEVYDELRYGIFADEPCGLVHGKMKPAEKEAVMQAFYENKIKLLVATTVIEVGVNVPNASIMVIEHAERFGLAQLHQLRGRIGRGQYKSFCILVSNLKTDSARERLSIMETTSDGFKLAEADLNMRGPGQFFGSLQHGLPDLKIANAIGDMGLLLQARQAAETVLKTGESVDSIIKAINLQYHNFLQITEN